MPQPTFTIKRFAIEQPFGGCLRVWGVGSAAACLLLVLMSAWAYAESEIATRKRIAAEIERAEPSERQRRLLELTFHPVRELRIFALEQLADVSPSAALRSRVAQLAKSEADPVLRGHARLLAAEWGVRGPRLDEPNRMPQVSALPLRPIGNPAGSAPPVFPGPKFLTPRTVVEAGEFNREPRPYRDPLIARASFDGPFNIGDMTPLQTPPTADPKRSVVQPSFTPVTPFWLQPSAVESLPTDALREKPEIGRFRLSSFEPPVLNRSLVAPADQDFLGEVPEDTGTFRYSSDAPLGFTGPSGVLPTEYQASDHFVPVEDRWRMGFPSWDRYNRGFPRGEDYPYQQGSWLDPYNQNVLKGDYPIVGQHTFLNLTATSFTISEYRQTPTPTTPFESTADPFMEPFFGDPNQYFYTQYFKLAVDLFHGNAAFKPPDWRIRIDPIFNVNYLKAEELGVVRPDVRSGKTRGRTDFALEEWFVEAKLADLSPDYDFASLRAGSQLFVSDFRGFLFKDVNRGVRLFGTRLANRDQFNLIWLDQTEKDTNSLLNSFEDRHQNTVIANYFRQDFVVPGYTAQLSLHYNRDEPSTRFDDNSFLVRPDPSGVFREHQVEAYYLGWAGDGHIGRYNISHQLYYVFGNDSLNPIAGCEQSISAQMAAVELSYDRDWIRFRTSYFFASGDNDPNDKDAGGFDTILDDPIFAGGEFSYWQRQQIKLFGVNLVQQRSLVPNLRSSKTQGQSNFVNPGLHILNLGMDVELTPKLRAIANANYLRFDTVNVLRTFTFQQDIGRDIGADLSIGLEWRPYLNDNVVFVFGSAVLIPGRGLRDLYGSQVPQNVAQITGARSEIPQFQNHFVELALTY